MAFLAGLSMVALLLTGVFLMFIVLIQRGRGGGLAGAFGGAGGQSAFGTKAGDVFTKITVVVAVIWVVLAGGSGFLLRGAASTRYGGGEKATETPRMTSPEAEPPEDEAQEDEPAFPGVDDLDLDAPAEDPAGDGATPEDDTDETPVVPPSSDENDTSADDASTDDSES